MEQERELLDIAATKHTKSLPAIVVSDRVSERDFLTWRQKEFIEKYEGTWYFTEKDEHSIFQAEAVDGLVRLDGIGG